MTAPGDFKVELFKAGTGYLGWTPDVVLNTPIPQLILAIDGRFDFAIKTNPFGAKPKPKEVDESVVRKRKIALESINAKAKAVRLKKCQKQANAS